MKLTFSDVVTGIFYLPARIFSGMTNLLLGSTSIDKYGDEEHSRGLFGFAIDAVKFVAGLLLDATKYVARGISGFVANHSKAIATAFWASLAVAGAVALTVAFWPAALAAVVNFSIAGVSIASVVGANFIAQVAASAGVAALLTSAAVYVGATVINTYNAIKDFFFGPKKPAASETTPETNPAEDTLNANSSANAMAALSKQSAPVSSSEEDAEPVHTVSLHQDEPVVTDLTDHAPAPAAGPSN